MKRISIFVALVALTGCSTSVSEPPGSGRSNVRGGDGGGGQGGASASSTGGAPGTGGEGGSTVVASSVSASTGGGGSPVTSCETAAPVGDVKSCPYDGTGSCGDGALCDDANNRFKVQCTSEGCSCIYNGTELCACTYPSPVCRDGEDEEGCCVDLNVGSCCPYPWIGHLGCTPTDQHCTTNAECCNYDCWEGTCQP
jgi:hypothetical protein